MIRWKSIEFLEEYNEELLTENLLLHLKIEKAIEYIKNGADFKSLHFIAGQDEDLWKIILSDNVRKDLLEILGDKGNE